MYNKIIQKYMQFQRSSMGVSVSVGHVIKESDNIIMLFHLNLHVTDYASLQDS